MSFEIEKRAAAHLLAVVENGSHSPQQIRLAYEGADPALIYLLFAWLRAHYRGHSAAEGVYGRIVAACASDVVARRVKLGEKDAVVSWFEETYDYRQLQRDDFIELIVEKLES